MGEDRTAVSELSFDEALVRRYDGVGPRYTSYPTAVQFTEAFTRADYVDACEASNGDPIPGPLSIYVHIPFCTSPCFYCACTKIITRDQRRAVEYLERLYREVELQSEHFDRDRPVTQLHLGGGTPTFLDMDQLEELLGVIGSHFRLDQGPEREFSIEIDPRTVDPTGIRRLTEMGFNRMSLGIQDFDPRVQQAVNRIQSAEETFALMDAAHEAGVDSVSVDLIYGLPFQSPESFSTTLDTVLAAAPDRLALYSYAHLPGMFKPQTRIRAEDLPHPETKLRLLGLSIRRLLDAGYVYIGMDHFARPDDELAVALRDGGLHRNFQGYSTRAGCDLIGLGMSAIGSVADCYSQNAKNIIEYYNDLDEGRLPVRKGLRLSEDDRLRREIIQAVMCHGRVDFTEISERWSVDARAYLAGSLARLRPLAEDGLVELDADGLRVTPVGRLLIRPVAACFDAYLEDAATRGRFSRVI